MLVRACASVVPWSARPDESGMAVTRLHILTRVMPNWNRPRQRILTSGKRKKRPMLPFWSSRWSTDDTRLPYKIGGGAPCLYPGPVVEDPMSRGVIPFSVNNERCAIRKGSSSSGTIELPCESRTVNWTTVGGVKGRRERFAYPNSAVFWGC